MTPEEHVAEAEKLLEGVLARFNTAERDTAIATAASVHLALARYKKDFPEPLWTES